jgi:hypothetical protein
MKKIIEILCVMAVAFALFINMPNNNTNSSNDINMSSLLTMNRANAEDGPFDVVCKCNLYANCKANGAQEVCASFNGNGFCSNYDSNCGF